VNEEVTINIPRTISSNKNCVVCQTTKNLIDIPEIAYVDTFINKNIIIPHGGKCCKGHLNRKNTFHKNDMNRIEIVSDITTLKNYEIEILLDRMRHLMNPTLFDKFSTKKINDNECKTYTGFTINQFNTILNSIKSMRQTSGRDISQALTTYLFWLKTGLDYRTIAAMFSIDNFQSVGEYCEQVRSALIKDFVPNNLGVGHMTRDEWITHNNQIHRQLFNVANDELILIADGTYLYYQKSKYNTLQRKQFSVQKSRHLVKPFVICTTSGKIFDILTASDNDAKIIETILTSNDKNCKDLQELLKPNDHLIVDRGFRDYINTLQNKYQLNTHMPSCIPPKQKQLTTFQANTSRFVTKCRWVVEVINGKLKTQFRANDKPHFNVTLSHTMDDLRISAALLNKFSSEYKSDKDNEITIINNMMTKLNTNNKLETIFLDHHIDKKRTMFTKLSSDSIQSFPRLDMKTIINTITLGTYQLKQSVSYIHENFDQSGDKIIETFDDPTSILTNYYDEHTRLLRTRIQSRHKNNTKYNSYIAYSINKHDTNPIKDWYCTCKIGTRTVGCCSHIGSVIYYLSNARYETIKNGKFTMEKIFNDYTAREGSDDSDDTVIYNTEQSQTEKIYPDLNQLSDSD
jgi:hypothetical protein